MNKTHHLKVANQLKADLHLPIQIVDILETAAGELCVYAKNPEKERTDLRQFRDDLSAATGLKVTVEVLGSREIAALVGGIGRCDQALCCSRWLPTPQNPRQSAVSGADLSGIPSDYIGVCGKLLCCLLYEEEGFKLECAKGESLRQKLKTESESTQKKIEVAREQSLTTVEPKKEVYKTRRLVRRFIK